MLNFPLRQEISLVKLVKTYGLGSVFEVYLITKDSNNSGQEDSIFLKSYYSKETGEKFAENLAYELYIPYEFVDESGED